MLFYFSVCYFIAVYVILLQCMLLYCCVCYFCCPFVSAWPQSENSNWSVVLFLLISGFMILILVIFFFFFLLIACCSLRDCRDSQQRIAKCLSALITENILRYACNVKGEHHTLSSLKPPHTLPKPTCSERLSSCKNSSNLFLPCSYCL